MSSLEFDFTLYTTNNIASYCFMDAGRSQETSGSETKDFITHRTASSMSILFACIGFPCLPSLMWRAQVNAYRPWVALQERSTELGEPAFFFFF